MEKPATIIAPSPILDEFLSLSKTTSDSSSSSSSKTDLLFDWDDRLAVQAHWTLTEKGWCVPVEWKMSTFGIGTFVSESSSTVIPKGTLLRVGVVGRNLIQFHSAADIEAFCSSRGGNCLVDEDGDSDENTNEDYQKRLRYVCDYVYSVGTNFDDHDPTNDRFIGMWFPGHGINHSRTESCVTFERTKDGSSILMKASRDLYAGQEIYWDYSNHGPCPAWLKEYTANKGLSTCNFIDTSDFICINEKDEKEEDEKEHDSKY